MSVMVLYDIVQEHVYIWRKVHFLSFFLHYFFLSIFLGVLLIIFDKFRAFSLYD